MSSDSEFPPRGSGNAKERENAPSELWVRGDALGPRWASGPNKIRLGLDDTGRVIGDRDRDGPAERPDLYKGKGDDRHIVTIAGSRAGKSSTVLIPNLLRYPGSVLVVDPKGELARRTAATRRDVLAHKVVVLDPFGVSGEASAAYNPLDELDASRDTFLDDVALVAEALIVQKKEEREPHWTDSARSLVRSIILFMVAEGGEVSLPRLRRILLGSEGSLTRQASNDDGDGDDDSKDGNDPLENYLFAKMMVSEAFGGLLSRSGWSFYEKSSREMGSILSTTREQTGFLDSESMSRVLAPSTLRLGMLKDAPMTIYMCLPAARLGTHFRWLRLIIDLGFVQLEDDRHPDLPVLFVLEEFAALDHMRSIERAAGFFAGFGVRLWAVLQDLSQLKALYEKSFETFLGNAGILQAFGNTDVATTEYLSKRLGQAQYVHTERGHASAGRLQSGDLGYQESLRSVPLLAPFEIARHFSRESHRQMILASGWPPIYCKRLGWE